MVIGALVGGMAFASLTANGTGTGSTSTGTVAIGAPVTQVCNYSKLVPGDLTGTSTCSMSVTYTGSLSGYLALTVAIQSKAGSGGHLLYDGSNTAGLSFSISDGHNKYTVPTGTGTTGGTCPSGFTCWTAANDLAAWYSGTTPSLSFASGNAVTWTVTPVFPRTAGNIFEGGTASLTITAQAVQGAPANPLPAGCTTSTIGSPCPASGTFTWS
jgi:hypothetical protein